MQQQTKAYPEPSVELLKSCIADLKKLTTCKVRKSSSYAAVQNKYPTSSSHQSQPRDKPPSSYREPLSKTTAHNTQNTRDY